MLALQDQPSPTDGTGASDDGADGASSPEATTWLGSSWTVGDALYNKRFETLGILFLVNYLHQIWKKLDLILDLQ